MRIERISDNQIRCTLNKRDLAERHLKISELAYGSDKAKKLFRDMMEQANMDYGFDAEDIPLMIEAIPTSRDSIVLIITKVDNPDELEQRFAPFQNLSSDDAFDDEEDFYDSDEEDYDDEDEDDEDALSYDEEDEEFDNNLFQSFEQLHDILEGEAAKKEDTENDKDKSDFVPLHEMLKKGKKEQPAKKKFKDCAFSFPAFSIMADASRAVHPLYRGKSSVWKDEENKTYYLTLSKPESSSSMIHICSMLNEFGKKEFYNPARKEYFKEHFTLLISSNAVEKLSKI